LEGKRLDVLQQFVPGMVPIGVLVNPKYPDADGELRELQEAARTINRQISIAKASTEIEVDTAFATLVQQGAGAVLVVQDPFLNSQRGQVVALAVRHKLPAMYSQRDYVDIGGLASYGPQFADGYRLAGVYVGKILKGAKPDELPVQQPTKFELIINLKAAKALALTVPPALLASADEVIE
jgi:putative ABC transport system substrate-binding protein